MKQLFILTMLLSIALFLSGCPQTQSSIDVTGEWAGTMEDNTEGLGTISAHLVQVGNAVSGTWQVDFPDKAIDNAGTVTGTISGNDLFGTLTPSENDFCPYALTAKVINNLITGEYVSSNCTQMFTGTITLQKVNTQEGEIEGGNEGGVEGEGETTNPFIVDWQRSWTGNIKEIFSTNDGGYLIASNNDRNVQYIKTNNMGLEMWNKIIPRTHSSENIAAISQTNDEGYLFVGNVDGTTWFGKINSQMNKEWDKGYSGDISGTGFSIFALSDGYIVGSQGNPNIILRKYDLERNLMWQKTLDFTFSGSVFMHQTSDSGFILSTATTSLGALSWDIIICGISNSGEISWFNLLGGSGNQFCHGLYEAQNGGYLLCGAGEEKFIIKTDDLGEEIWTKKYPFYVSSLISIPGDRYMFAGSSNGIVTLCQINLQGDMIRWGLSEDNAGSAQTLIGTNDGGFIVGYNSNKNLYLLKTLP